METFVLECVYELLNEEDCGIDLMRNNRLEIEIKGVYMLDI